MLSEYQREEVPRDEKAARRLSSDLHLKDTNASLTDTGAWWSR